MEERSRTWIEPEEYAYPNGGFTRKGRAILRHNQYSSVVLPWGEVRAVKASIPDTYFTIPARLLFRGKTVVGFLSKDDDGEYTFTPEAD